MQKPLVLYVATVVVFFAIDIVWLSVVARNFYFTQLDPWIRAQPNWPVAAGFYLLYIIGILVFAVAPAIASGSLAEAAWRGALFGLIAYATYDLTNLSTLKDWPWQLAVVDTIWGAVLTGTVATASYTIHGWLQR